MASTETSTRIEELLGDDADTLLQHVSRTIDASQLHLPGPDFVDRVVVDTDRSRPRPAQPPVALRQRPPGRHGLRLDPPRRPGHRALGRPRASPRTPLYFDPENLVQLAIEGGCNAVASTFGVLGVGQPALRAPDPVHRQAQPQRAADLPQRVRPDHVRLGPARPGSWARRASARRSTSARRRATGRSSRSPQAFEEAHRLGHVHRAVVLPAQLAASSIDGTDYHARGRPHRPGQPPRRDDRGRHHQAEAAREQRRLQGGQRLNGGYGKTSKLVYEQLTTDNPIDLTRWQVANCYMGRAPLINSGGASSGESDLAEAVRTAVINKRAGGTGLISGRKAFQRPMEEGVGLLHAIQDVYLSPEVTIA